MTFELTGPGTIAGRYLRQFWQPVMLSHELSKQRPRPIQIMGERFTIYRGAGGTVHLSQFRCPHRGTQLSTGWVEGDSLRCRYHGWKFDAQGQCIEQPGGRNNVGFADKVKLNTHPVREYLGLIFAYLGEGAAPELPRFQQFDESLLLIPMKYERRCNYFQNMENSIDEMHIPFVHNSSAFTNAKLNEELPVVDAEETPYGFMQTGLRSNNRMRKQHFIMPNILLAKVPPELPEEKGWRDYISWRVPLDDTTHMSFFVQSLSVDDHHEAAAVASRVQNDCSETLEIATQILAGEARLDDYGGYQDLLNLQDMVVQLGQGPIADRSAERLTRSDAPILLLRKLWAQELSLLKNSKTLTDWKIPKAAVITAGL